MEEMKGRKASLLPLTRQGQERNPLDVLEEVRERDRRQHLEERDGRWQEVSSNCAQGVKLGGEWGRGTDLLSVERLLNIVVVLGRLGQVKVVLGGC